RLSGEGGSAPSAFGLARRARAGPPCTLRKASGLRDWRLDPREDLGVSIHRQADARPASHIAKGAGLPSMERLGPSARAPRGAPAQLPRNLSEAPWRVAETPFFVPCAQRGPPPLRCRRWRISASATWMLKSNSPRASTRSPGAVYSSPIADDWTRSWSAC